MIKFTIFFLMSLSIQNFLESDIEIEHENNDCIQQNTIFIQEKKILKIQIQNLKDSLISIEQKKNHEIQNLQAQITFLMKKNKNLIKQNTNGNMINKNLNIEKNYYEKLQKQVKYLLKKNELLIQENTNLLMKNTQLNINKNQMNNLEKTNKNLKVYLRGLKIEINKYERIKIENISLKKKITKFSSFETSIINIKKDYKKLNEEYNILLADKKVILDTKKSLELKIDLVLKENILMKKINDNLKTQVYRLQTSIKKYENGNNCLKQKKITYIGDDNEEQYDGLH